MPPCPPSLPPSCPPTRPIIARRVFARRKPARSPPRSRPLAFRSNIWRHAIIVSLSCLLLASLQFLSVAIAGTRRRPPAALPTRGGGSQLTPPARPRRGRCMPGVRPARRCSASPTSSLAPTRTGLEPARGSARGRRCARTRGSLRPRQERETDNLHRPLPSKPSREP